MIIRKRRDLKVAHINNSEVRYSPSPRSEYLEKFSQEMRDTIRQYNGKMLLVDVVSELNRLSLDYYIESKLEDYGIE